MTGEKNKKTLQKTSIQNFIKKIWFVKKLTT